MKEVILTQNSERTRRHRLAYRIGSSASVLSRVLWEHFDHNHTTVTSLDVDVDLEVGTRLNTVVIVVPFDGGRRHAAKFDFKYHFVPVLGRNRFQVTGEFGRAHRFHLFDGDFDGLFFDFRHFDSFSDLDSDGGRLFRQLLRFGFFRYLFLRLDFYFLFLQRCEDERSELEYLLALLHETWYEAW